MKHSGINMEQVKISNRSSILKLINDCGPISRKDIALTTGLTPAAVTVICTSLIEKGILTETGIDDSSKNSGRKKVFVNINYDIYHVLAISIETEHTTIAVCNLKGKIYSITEIPTDKSIEPETFLNKIAAESKKLLENDACKNLKVDTASVTLPGIVDVKNGKSIRSYGIWNEEVEVQKILYQQLGMEIILQNNVNAFTTAELFFGTGRQSDNFLLIKWGPGVGSAIVINHKIYESNSKKAAELGHIIVDTNGEKCSCGKTGCLETKISWSALNKIRNFEGKTFSQTIEVASQKEKEQFQNAFSLFSVAIVNYITTLAPNKVVLCGKLFSDEEIRNKIIGLCKKLDFDLKDDAITYSELSEKEEIIGPVAVFLEQKLRMTD